MKTLSELKSAPYLVIGQVGSDGGTGEVHSHNWSGTVIWSFGGGWDHVSVAPYKKRIIPTWDDMCRLKDMFFRDDHARDLPILPYVPHGREWSVGLVRILF